MNAKLSNHPKRIRKEIERAIEILKEEGCSEVFLFGSAARGGHHEPADFDIAVRGCPKGRFFHVWARLFMNLSRPVDLVKLDSADPFAECLLNGGELLRVG